MSDPQQRIGEILRRIDYETTGGDLAARFSTGPEQWAEKLVTELGLVEEWRTSVVADPPSQEVFSDNEKWKEFVKNAPGAELRYVTAWMTP